MSIDEFFKKNGKSFQEYILEKTTALDTTKDNSESFVGSYNKQFPNPTESSESYQVSIIFDNGNWLTMYQRQLEQMGCFQGCSKDDIISYLIKEKIEHKVFNFSQVAFVFNPKS